MGQVREIDVQPLPTAMGPAPPENVSSHICDGSIARVRPDDILQRTCRLTSFVVVSGSLQSSVVAHLKSGH